MKGGMEAIYLDPGPPRIPGSPSLFGGPRQGLYAFAPSKPATGSMLSARRRLRIEGEPQAEAPVLPEP